MKSFFTRYMFSYDATDISIQASFRKISRKNQIDIFSAADFKTKSMISNHSFLISA